MGNTSHFYPAKRQIGLVGMLIGCGEISGQLKLLFSLSFCVSYEVIMILLYIEKCWSTCNNFSTALYVILLSIIFQTRSLSGERLHQIDIIL